jgi:serine/threonine-protein kinase
MLHEEHLSVGFTVRILRNVLEALAHAHAMGVVHRDIKPENIFLSGTNAVLADFGIAKAVGGVREAEHITSPGMTIGTPTYMAPEQFAGDPSMDHRVDLYAVGVVGYEMLTNRLPWQGTTPHELLTSKARNRRVSLKSSRVDAPPALIALLDSCLEWEPADRPASAVAALRSLEAVSLTPITPVEMPSRSLPRLKFSSRKRAATALTVAAVVLSAAGGIAWRSRAPRVARRTSLAILAPRLPAVSGVDVLGEQLYHLLFRSLRPVSGLNVVDEVSVSRYIVAGLSSKQISDSLRASGIDSVIFATAAAGTDGGYLLSLSLSTLRNGSVQTIAGPIALHALELAPDSVNTLVRLLAAQAVAHLGLTTTNRAVPETQIIDAWIAWSKARDAYSTRTPDGVRQAITYFERAIQLDSTYAQAHAELASAIALALFYHYRLPDAPYVAAARALRHAERAIALQPELADGYLARGYLASNIGGPVGFIEDNFKTAQNLNSTNPYSQVWYTVLLANQGKFTEAVDRLEQQVHDDPKSAAQRVALALYALPAHQQVTAMRAAQEARRLQPALPMAAELELTARLLFSGRLVEDCDQVPAGPYLGLRALCLEKLAKSAESRATVDSLFRIVTDRAPSDTRVDLALYAGEMAVYHAAHHEAQATQQWIRQAMAESPAGIDRRLARAGFYSASDMALADTLRSEAWTRVQVMAKKDH